MSRKAYLSYGGKLYDLRAIVGVAHRYVADGKPLKWDELNGKDGKLKPLLERLGFEVKPWSDFTHFERVRLPPHHR